MSAIWLAAMTAPGTEFKTEKILKLLGFDCFVPSMMKERCFRPSLYRRAKKSEVRCVVFTRMVFVAVDRDRWPVLVHETYDYVRGVLAVAGRPRVLSAKEIADLRGVAMPKAWGMMRANREFQVGETVRVVDGPFASFEAIVDTIDLETGEVTADTEIFGRKTRVKYGVDQLERAA